MADRERSDHFLRDMLASSPDCIFVFDSEGRCRFVNVAGAALVGRTPDELRDSFLSHLDLPADAAAPVERDVLSLFATGQTITGTTSLPRSGGVRNLEYTLSPIRAADGSVDAALLVARDITERQRSATVALVDSEARFRATFEQAAVGVAHVGLGGEWLRLNRKILEILGYAREDLEELTFQDITYPPDLEKDLRQMRRLLAGELKTYTLEKRYVRRDGSLIWGNLTGSLVRTEDGRPSYFVAVVEDISRRKRLEEERERLLGQLEGRVREREHYLERLQQVMSLSLDALGENTVQGLLQRVVDGAWSLTQARAATAAYDYRDGAFAFAATAQAVEGAAVPPDELFAPGRGGVYLDLICRANSIRLTDAELRRRPEWQGLPEGHRQLRGLLGARIVGRDGLGNGLIAVSDRQEGEFTPEDEALLVQLAALASLGLRHIEAHDEAERRAAEMDATFAAMTDGVIVYDANGKPSHANPAVIAAYGLDPAEYPREEVVRLVAIRHLDGSPVRLEQVPSTRALSGETMVGERYLFRNANGTDTAIVVSGSPLIVDGKIRGAVTVWHDVTGVAELERHKGQFVAVAAHELRTPVTIMKGYAQALLRTSEAMPSAHRKMLEAINRGSDRIDAIVNELLDITRLESGNLDLDLRRVDLSELIEEVVDRAALTASKHRLRVVKADPVVVQADRYRLEQVLANLLDNAMRYSPDGGDVEVALRHSGNEAIISVRDSGVGIPAGKQGHIFQRFYRAHTDTPYDYGGMGVALYISQQVVARHRGRMWFESEEGRGSTFYLALPTRGARLDA